MEKPWRRLAVATMGSTLLGAAALAAPGAATNEHLADRALPCLRFLVEESRYGAANGEIAAWLVRRGGSGGELECILWPPSREAGRAQWPARRPVPAGAVAQVHTHATRAASGRSFGAQPSRQDCATARRLAMPVWTVSPQGLGECSPDTGRAAMLWGSDWLRRALPAAWSREGDRVRWPDGGRGEADMIAETTARSEDSEVGVAPQAEPSSVVPRRPRTKLR